MAGFIECKGENGEIIEVDIEENRTVRLETLRSLFGAEVSALTYTNPMSGRERVVRVADNKLLEPKDGWEFEDRIYSISFGFQCPSVTKPVRDSVVPGPISANKVTPFTRKVLAHPLIKKENDTMVDDYIDLENVEGMITGTVAAFSINFNIVHKILQSQNQTSKLLPLNCPKSRLLL